MFMERVRIKKSEEGRGMLDTTALLFFSLSLGECILEICFLCILPLRDRVASLSVVCT